MHIMIFQGSPEASQKNIASVGGRTNEALFSEALQSQDGSVKTFTLNVVDGERLPQGMALTDFDGVVITGSPLSTYENVPGVHRQIELARAVFEAGVPTFGSCWGLQLMTAALGGTVRLNPRGREIGFARSIALNETGRAHAMYRDKPTAFAAFCSHQDEVQTLPEGGRALASNAVSDVQAAEICRGESCFWGVQYHPEFDFGIIAALIGKRGDRHIAEGLARTPDDVAGIVADLRSLSVDPSRKDIAWRYGLEADVLDSTIRRVEFANWLATKVRPYAAAKA